MPEKSKKLLELISSHAGLQNSDYVMVPACDILGPDFTESELDLAEKYLIENNKILNVSIREHPRLPLSQVDVEELLNQGPFVDAYILPGSVVESIRVYQLGGDIKSSQFFEEKAILKIGNKEIELTPSKNEFELCRSLFGQKPNIFISWDKVYEDMTGNSPTEYEARRARRMVYDTYLALNKRIEKEASIKNFLIWKNKQLKRRL